MRMPFATARHQLAAYSPLSGKAVARAFLQRSDARNDAADRLAATLRATFDADDVILTDSGTSALQLAIRVAIAAGSRTAAPVALPAFTCFEVATAAVGAGADVLLYDVLPDSLAPDSESLELALRAGARTVVVSPLFGIPVDWESIAEQLGRYDAIAIEDAAQGHGALWHGRPQGSFGSLSVLSFGRGKGWTGSGGGALLARGNAADTQHAHKMAAFNGGRARDAATRALAAMAQWTLGRPSLYGIPAAIPALGLGRTEYHAPMPTMSMDTFNARLVLATLDAATREVAKRREVARLWREGLPATTELRAIAVPAGGEAGYVRFPIRLLCGNERVATCREARRLGIAASYPAPLNTLRAIQARRVGPATSCRGAEALARELVTLPTHSLVSASDVGAIMHLLRRLLPSSRSQG